ncbi:MAG: 50S ribosomal protein L10 [Planctomycetia bacterium 21-64-5]|nr:MAG: 50S ribosomal protein L10 [Planctomycetia bacterium 21-64-5]HQU42982.1 50S ribosomal protein L10 [Pirellulales bacterium]
MSKFVKNLISDDLKRRLDGVENALLVSVAGLDANKNSRLRKTLREKNIQLLVIKNSLARRATEGTPLAAAFEQMEGSLAVVWGAEDIVSLAKQVTALSGDKQYEPFAARGGVMDGSRLTAEQVAAVSKWPSRQEQLSILVGQILSPGATLVAQLTGAGAALASQIKQKGEEQEGADGAAEATATT